MNFSNVQPTVGLHIAKNTLGIRSFRAFKNIEQLCSPAEKSARGPRSADVRRGAEEEIPRGQEVLENLGNGGRRKKERGRNFRVEDGEEAEG